MNTTKAFPLHWPEAVKRTKWPGDSKFKRGRSFEASRKEVERELGLMEATHVVISTNLPLRLDGYPYASASPGEDRGVAVYFRRRTKEHCIACDNFSRISDNAYAIAKTIEALRTIERYGSSQLGDQAYSAFEALPPAGGEQKANRHWREVLDVPEGISGADQLLLAESRYRRATRNAHPDRGGTEEAMQELNGAIARAREELK